MRSDSSLELAENDPVLVVPWADPERPATTRFVDLRENPYDLDQIAEAEAHPPLMQALRSLNAPRSPVFTAKCDAWELPAGEDELSDLRLELDLEAEESACGFASYVDLLWRDRTTFASLHLQQQRLHRLARLLEPLDHPQALAETVLRPALVDLTAPHEGFAVTLYVKAAGTDAAHAYERWSLALEAVTGVMRGKEFASA